MSRVGKNPVEIPSGVEVNFANDIVTVKGKLGQLEQRISELVKFEKNDTSVVVSPLNNSRTSRSLWGTTRSNIANMVKGVSEGFTIDLDIVGVGYRASVSGNKLQLQLGFSHDVIVDIEDGINIKCAKPTQISISGYDKQKVGELAAQIRSYRPPEPYKGKGVKYADEIIVRKEGKKK